VKTVIQSFQELLDSRLRGNDKESAFFKGLKEYIEIGENAVIGCGAIVVKNIRDSL
jgi:hypothetical protein